MNAITKKITKVNKYSLIPFLLGLAILVSVFMLLFNPSSADLITDEWIPVSWLVGSLGIILLLNRIYLGIRHYPINRSESNKIFNNRIQFISNAVTKNNEIIFGYQPPSNLKL